MATLTCTSRSMELAVQAREEALLSTPISQRHHFAQHLTPPETALLAVSLFDDAGSKRLDCLDLGGGTGMLSSALLDRYGDRIALIDTFEIDTRMAEAYDRVIRPIIQGETHRSDVLATYFSKEYDRIVMNPPYGKMSANDPRHINLPVFTPNLYAAFMVVGLSCLAKGGEMVAIVPRSWTNGSYFTTFRRYVLSRYSLDAMHVYESRSEVFSDTDVLQETMIVRFSRKKQSLKISVGLSQSKTDMPKVQSYDYQALIVGDAMVIRTEPSCDLGLARTVSELGFCPSTGKVVDFRSKDHVFIEKPNNRHVVPLVYAGNFRSGVCCHPCADIGKPQWFADDDPRRVAQTLLPGYYVVVRRFTSKEERRRVVAYPLCAKEPLALENHLDFVHMGSPRNVISLPTAELANGLAAWLNTTAIDRWFRGVSGSTQVNAHDIKNMPCPNQATLETIGKKWTPFASQHEIDHLCMEALCSKKS